MTDERYREPDPLCGWCGGVGSVDSGGQTPWGDGIDIPCPCTHNQHVQDTTAQHVQDTTAQHVQVVTTQQKNTKYRESF